MTKMYIVKYNGGSYDDFYVNDIFITNKKSTATKYVTKFNRVLKAYSKYYEKFESNKYGTTWFDDDAPNVYYSTWHKLKNINNAYW